MNKPLYEGSDSHSFQEEYSDFSRIAQKNRSVMLMTAGRATRWRFRRVLAAFLVLWLNVALAPCAMAQNAPGDHRCPRCPPLTSADQTHLELSSVHHTGEENIRCADKSSDCATDSNSSVDGRTQLVKVKSPPDEAFFPVTWPSASFESNASRETPAGKPSSAPGLPAPLFCLHCVYLI